MVEEKKIDPALIELNHVGLINEKKVILYDLHDNEVVSYRYEVKEELVSKVYKRLKLFVEESTDNLSKKVFDSCLFTYNGLLPNIEKENFFNKELKYYLDNIEWQYITNDNEVISYIKGIRPTNPILPC